MAEATSPRKAGYRNCNFPSRHDIEGRWNLLAPKIPRTTGWFLDIGTNNGDTLRRLADLGHYAIGLEADEETVSRNLPQNSAVMISAVKSGDLVAYPRFDGIFMLSVFHRIWALQGPAEAKAILAAAAAKTPVLFFEGSSRHARYRGKEAEPPDFADLDADQSRLWHERLFSSTIPGAEVEYLGATQTTKTKDPRPLFHIQTGS